MRGISRIFCTSLVITRRYFTSVTHLLIEQIALKYLMQNEMMNLCHMLIIEELLFESKDKEQINLIETIRKTKSKKKRKTDVLNCVICTYLCRCLRMLRYYYTCVELVCFFSFCCEWELRRESSE